ncbi:hypothetical protein [Alkalibacterium sp. MB6]|uniref:hypothetical protein n=1 Tax=Alkalibacterium sp. MB6 TaxID=2081965 RepID=UPI001379D3A9|nr:hypothetical protein [Alkalibacterium sp. MB6]
MPIIELGALASGLLAVITLTSKIIKLITTIQSLVNRLDQLQKDMATTKEVWAETTQNYIGIDQRLRVVEFELAEA